jgi:hypothetical protein
MSMDEKIMPPVAQPAPPAAQPTPTFTPPPAETVGSLVPKTWRDIVDTMLGKDFGVTVGDSSGGNYVVKVHVPVRYDCRVGDEKAMSKEDIRACLVRRASDIDDLKTWCMAIKSNIAKKYPDFK